MKMLSVCQQQEQQQQQKQQKRRSYQQQQQHQQRQLKQQRYIYIFVFLTLKTTTYIQFASGADLVINIPESSANSDAFYRIDFTPPFGYPEPNTTIPAREIGKELKFSRALPGTKYNFWLYYTNFTHHDLLTWTVAITTVPEPPASLSVQVRSTKNAIISWLPPSQGSYSGFKINVVGLTDATGFMRTFYENNTFQHPVRELTSGATYQVQAYTIFDGKESAAYTSRNFTTKPNTPGKFIVWFRNETTMLVLWQPPLLGGIYTHYKVSIEPPDALQSVFYVERDDEPGPAQAAFKGLVPGRPYNISVQTMSENIPSEPTTARYLTMPIRPMNVTFDSDKITTNSFRVRWEVPKSFSVYDSFQVSLVSSRRFIYTVPRTNATTVYYDYRESLEPGKTYGVVVKTISDNVNSWPATGEVTLRPMPVQQLMAFRDDYKNIIHVSWEPDKTSTQKEYKITYYDMEADKEQHDMNQQVIHTQQTEYRLEHLLAGRHYQISVQAVSKNMTSIVSTIVMDTRPAAPVIVELKSIPLGLNISWKSDVNSRQEKYEIQYSRNGTFEVRTIVTNQTQLVIKNLQLGSGYDVKVYAVNHNLRSDTHSYFQAVAPKPPRNLTIESLDSSSIQLRWLPPDGGEFSEYSVRFRTKSEQWQRLPNVHENKVTIKDLRRGERYIVQLNTVSHGVESLTPLEVNTTMSPQPVTNVVPLVDSRNLTLEWPTLEDRVDYYTIKWWSVDAPNEQMYKNVTEQKIIAAPFVRVAIDELMPGTQYKFEIQSHSYGYNSGITLLSTSTVPLILSDVFVADCDTAAESHSLMISYTPTPLKATKFDIYRFSLGDLGVKNKEKLANDTERKVIFNDLVPGRLYNISVWTLSNGVASLPLQRQERLQPEPIVDLLATDIAERQVTLHWQGPRGDFTDFEVQYLNEDDVLLQNTTADHTLTLAGLLPFHNYVFTVVVRSGNESSVLRSSTPLSISVLTKQAPPGRVDFFESIDVRPRELTLKWYMSQREANGIIEHFSVSYANKHNANDSGTIDFEPGETAGTVRELEPGADYVFAIQAKSALGYGPEREFTQTIPILAPPCTDPTVTPTEVAHTSSTIQMRFRKNYFSDENGRVRKYSIIVAEDVTKNASGLEIPSWQDVQSYSVWLPYQSAESFQPFVNEISAVNFTVGGEKCSPSSSGFCNGPLKSGTTYHIKVRAFTDDDKFTDTAYSAAIRTDSNITLFVVIATFVSVLAVIGGLVYLHRRYTSLPKRPKRPRLCTAFPMPSSNSTTSRPVHLKNFIEYCRVMSADSDIRFSEEFDELKHVGRYQSCTFADLPCNRPKNRFSNILPYDHSRFKLQPADDEEGSDYINANYVPGYNSPREFIVTQGPLPSTCEDFWRMCWESSSRVIIMLTRCVEKGREKCHQYWPSDRSNSCYFGDIRVRVISASHYNDWVVTRIMLYKGTDQRLILHFHFTTWPDFGVPDPPATLVRFVQAFRVTIGVEARPIIVHCSAGVGRSGTFIALDHIMHQIRSSEYVDIFGVVYNMRKERVQMVQTEQQYICIHECLILWLYDGLQEKPLPQPLDVQHRQTPFEVLQLQQAHLLQHKHIADAIVNDDRDDNVDDDSDDNNDNESNNGNDNDVNIIYNEQSETKDTRKTIDCALYATLEYTKINNDDDDDVDDKVADEIETETETDGEEAAVIKRNSTNVSAATASVAFDDDVKDDEDEDSEDTANSIEDDDILMMMKVL